MTTTSDKSNSRISLEKVESGNVLTASFWRSGNDDYKQQGVYSAVLFDVMSANSTVLCNTHTHSRDC